MSARGRVFRMTPEQVLNHLLPVIAFSDGLSLTVRLEHYDMPYWETLEQEGSSPLRPRGLDAP